MVCACFFFLLLLQLDDLHALLDNVSAERDAALGGATAAAANGEDLPAKVEAMQAEVSREMFCAPPEGNRFEHACLWHRISSILNN